MNPDERAGEVVTIIKEYVTRTFQPLLDRISELEKQLKEMPIALGKDGRDGRDGRDGKDAVEIDILPSINEEKSYQKGVYASHKGGLWLSKSETEGMNGWYLIVDGVNKINIQKTGKRNFTTTVEKSSGKAHRTDFEIPIPLYEGVYKAGFTYSEGDTVTYAGSLWHCNEPTSGKPGENKSWVLMAKRGRDGK